MKRFHYSQILLLALLAAACERDGRGDTIVSMSLAGEACTRAGAASCATTFAAPPPVSNIPYVYATPSNGASWIAFNEGGWPGDLDVPVSTVTPFGSVQTSVSSASAFRLTTYLLGDDYACFQINGVRQTCTVSPGFQPGEETVFSILLMAGSYSLEYDLYNVYPTGQGIYNETALAFSSVMAPAPPVTAGSPEPSTAALFFGAAAGLLTAARMRFRPSMAP